MAGCHPLNLMKKQIIFALLACFASAYVQAISPTPPSPTTSADRLADGKPGANQVRVVYYRKDDRVGDGVANLYVDGEFHAALLPNSYNVFCLTPGRHFIGSWFKEAPHYLGKEAPTQEYQFKAGETIFLRVDASYNGRSLIKQKQQVELESVGLHESIHMLSRASAVVPCKSGVFDAS